MAKEVARIGSVPAFALEEGAICLELRLTGKPVGVTRLDAAKRTHIANYCKWQEWEDDNLGAKTLRLSNTYIRHNVHTSSLNII